MVTQDEVKKIFGKAVTELRLQKGLTQEQLAEHLNLSTHTINRIENGNAFVSCDVLTQICNLFKVSPSVLFTPKPHILYEEHMNYVKKITELLPSFKTNKLKDLYNCLVVIDK